MSQTVAGFASAVRAVPSDYSKPGKYRDVGEHFPRPRDLAHWSSPQAILDPAQKLASGRAA
jgi:hypothetical protein